MAKYRLKANRVIGLLAILVCLSLAGCESESQAQTDDYATSLATARAGASAELTTIDDINAVLRTHDRVYRPDGTGPFPAMLFFHGCSGPTLSHEEDWAEFYNERGIVVIAVDSHSGRGVDWERVCSGEVLTPWEVAGDVLATLAYARTLDYIDSSRIGLTGFSHGAATVWTTLALASNETPPINLESWPEGGINGVKLAIPFYITCMEPWTVPVHTISFLGEADRYIDESTCDDYVNSNPYSKEFFAYHVFPGATHTFDHARPSQVNIDSGSVYDQAATAESKRLIETALDQYLN